VIDGSGSTLVVEGSPGLGKSTLLAETALRAKGGSDELTVLRFCCGELEQQLAWGAVVGLLGPVLENLSPATRRQRLGGLARAAMPLFAATPAGSEGEGGGDEFGVVRALFVLVRELAVSGPLLILLDDVHWADRQSLQFLAYLQRRLTGRAVGLVLAMRPPAAGGEPDLLGRLITGPDTRLFQLSSLALDSVVVLVREQAFPQAGETFCQACWQVTAGNPFFLHELLLELREDQIDPNTSPEELIRITPPSVLRSVLVRLGRIQARHATELANATAILGDGAVLRDAAVLAGIDPEAAVVALDALAAAELLAPGEPLRFVHPLVRGAVYADIPAAHRALQHARAAQLLAESRASPELVALHLLQAPLDASPQTVTTLRAAARSARVRGAAPAAVRFLRRALQEPPAPEERVELLIELAHAETAAGDPAAVGHLSSALELVNDERRRAELLLAMGWTEHHAGRFDAAADAFEAGLALEPADEALAAELEAGYLVCATLDSSRVTDAMRRIRIIESGSEEVQSPARRMLLGQLLFARTTSGAPHQGIIELAQRIWAGGRLLVDEGADSQTLWTVIASLSWADAYAPSLEAIELALAAADHHGLALAHARGRYARAWPNYWMGKITEAAADAQAAIEIWAGGLETYLPAAIYWFGLAQIELGDIAAAQRGLALAEPTERWEGTGMMGFIYALQGELHLQAGQPEQALASFQACGETMDALLVTSPSVMPWRSNAALALLLLGEQVRARVMAQEELEHALSSGAPRAIGVSLRVCGLCAGGKGNPAAKRITRGARAGGGDARVHPHPARARSGDTPLRTTPRGQTASRNGAGSSPVLRRESARASDGDRAARSGRTAPAFARDRGAGPDGERAPSGRARRPRPHQPAHRRPAADQRQGGRMAPAPELRQAPDLKSPSVARSANALVDLELNCLIYRKGRRSAVARRRDRCTAWGHRLRRVAGERPLR